MKPVYKNIEAATGVHIGGVYSIKIAPIEWIADLFTPDFNTGKIFALPNLLPGYNWLIIDAVKPTFDFAEVDKVSPGGVFTETNITGNNNCLTAAGLETINTIRYHQLVILCTDTEGNTRIVGNKETGGIIQFSSINSNKQGGEKNLQFKISHESERPAPMLL